MMKCVVYKAPAFIGKPFEFSTQNLEALTIKDFKTRDFLQVFELVLKEGEKQYFNSPTGDNSGHLAKQSFFSLDGLKAWHDTDGYTCWLSFKDLTVTLLFHGKIALDFEKSETFDEFSRMTNRLLK